MEIDEIQDNDKELDTVQNKMEYVHLHFEY